VNLVVLAAAVARIVSTAPSATEMLFAVGAGPRVVAVTRFCDYPPEVAALPKVGGFLDLSYEAILAARPDLVVGARNGANRDVVERLAAAGVGVEFPPAESIGETLAAIRAIGARVGAPGRGAAVAAEVERALARVSGFVAGARPARAFVLYGDRPLVAAGAGTFADELLVRARGVNLAGDSAVRYPTMPVEAMAARTPDVVLDVSMPGSSERSGGPASPLLAFPSVPAVRDGRLVALDAPEVVRPGPRLGRALELVARALHPELFGAP